MTAQAELFGIPSHGVDDQTRSLLDLIAGDPIHAGDRRRIVAAIVRDARRHGGKVDMNRVRIELTAPESGHLTVYPRVIGAVVYALSAKGALVASGWLINEDRHGRNSGKPLRAWRLVVRFDTDVIPAQPVEPTTGVNP